MQNAVDSLSTVGVSLPLGTAEALPPRTERLGQRVGSLTKNLKSPRTIALIALLVGSIGMGLFFWRQNQNSAAPPAQIAVRYGAQAVTYGEIERDSIAVATHLHALGMRAGDRIAVWLPNIPAWLVLLFACARWVMENLSV